ncbi:MAG: Rrf2 family transcriptional regulator [Phycisphaerales bacterium]
MLSQTTEYALRATICLAYAPDRLVSTSELADQTKVPMNYLAKVLQLLARAEIVTGRRGVGGGYKLTKTASEISMLDVIDAIDPIRRITSCPLSLDNHSGALCPLHRTLDTTISMMIKQFTGITLADLIGERGESKPLCDKEMTAKVELTLGGL